MLLQSTGLRNARNKNTSSSDCVEMSSVLQGYNLRLALQFTLLLRNACTTATTPPTTTKGRCVYLTDCKQKKKPIAV
jgi:hypothetical protein